MVFDRHRGVCLFYGGNVQTTGLRASDIWEYSGPCGTGDFDADGVVTTAHDLPRFVAAVLNDVSSCAADFNGDTVVNGLDVAQFVDFIVP